jgi:hypothetical protein
MNSVATQQKRFIKLTPSNNSTTGFSPDSSQPIIRFSVADTMAHANMKDARLNFRIRVERAAGVSVAQGDDFNIDLGVGMCGVLDQVIVSSRRYGNQLEAVHNMGRLNSAWYSSLYSPKQMQSNQNLLCRTTGKGRYNGTHGETGAGITLTDQRQLLQRKYLRTSATATGATEWNGGAGLLDCSVPIHLGLFQNEDVNLNQVGGLEISIYLAQSRAIFYGVSAGNNPPTASSTYSLHDVSLTMPLLYMSAGEIQQQVQSPESMMSFMSWTSIYSVLDSTFASVAHRLALKGLLSSIHNFLPTNAINNSSFNNHALLNPGIEELTFLRDGAKNPMEKSALVMDSRATTLANKASTQAEILNDYLGAYRNPRDILYTQVTPENLNGIGATQCRASYGVGCNYDPSAGAGIAVNGTISYDIRSKIQELNSSSANWTPQSTEPYAMFSFYLARQNYMVSPQGITSV